MHHGIKLARLVGLASVAFFVLTGTGCSRVRQLASGRASASAEPSASVTVTGASVTTGATAGTTGGGWSAKPKFDGTNRPWVDEGGRQGKCTFVGWRGTGEKRTSMFKLELPPGKKADHIQTWQFYYDAAGKQIDEYPSATNPENSAHDDGVQDLGETGSRIKSGVDSVECEITKIGYPDGTYWWNENLMASGMRRPKGGFPAAMLKDHAGEKVQVVSVDVNKLKVTLKNLTDRPIRTVEVELLCWKKDDEGKDDKEWTSDSIDVDLGANATMTTDLEIRSSRFDHCRLTEGAVSEVRFADDTVFINRNLEASARP